MHSNRLSTYLRQAIDQGMEGFAILDDAGKFVYVNPANAAMYGYQPEDLIGNNWTMLYQQTSIDLINRDFIPELATSGYCNGEVEGLRRDRSTFPVELTLTALKNEAGEFDGFVCNCRDITERRLAQDSLNRLQKADALGQLTGGVAHDFNNLLSVILGNIDLSLTHELPSDVRRQLNQAYSAGQRGAKLVSRLLAFARAQDLNPEAINLNQFVESLSQLLLRTLEESMRLVWMVEPNVWQCHADPSQLESAILNLILNARDAMPNGGHITVHLYNRYDADNVPFVHISVRDDGEGMPPEITAQMFDPFFTTKPVATNSGLGLSMVQGFVNQSGGHIDVVSRPGEGTTVDFSLPAYQPAAQADATADTQAGNRRIADGDRLLLVEDDEHVRETTSRMLTHLGFDVIAVSDGQQALDSINNAEDISLVLCDIRLPGPLQGTDIAASLAEQRPDLGCLLMTGYAPETSETQEDGSSPVQRLNKPFTIDELSAGLKPHLKARNP